MLSTSDKYFLGFLTAIICANFYKETIEMVAIWAAVAAVFIFLSIMKE